MRASRVVVVGDTQRALPLERWPLGREANDRARARLAVAFLDEPADARAHLGDLVGRVGSEMDWARFDRELPPSRLASAPFLVCRGNHDVGGMLFGRGDEFERRHPSACGGLQALDVGPLRLLAVDTNRRALGDARWRLQAEALDRALAIAERDDSVRHVVVLAHHPPLTNGRWLAPDRAQSRDLRASLARCERVRACLSGHVHGYERFTEGGVRYVVSGGGGGPRASHLRGRDERARADLELPDPHPFHYLVIEASEERFEVRAVGFDTPEGPWREVDAFGAGS